MPSIETVADTPYYMLLDGSDHLNPTITQLNSGIEYSAIYGFSDKERYDRFCRNSESALRPYPLVKGFLRNGAAAPGEDVKLVVLDAVGPREPCLHAATMQAVLEAQENQTAHVVVSLDLMFDQDASAYRPTRATSI